MILMVQQTIADKPHKMRLFKHQLVRKILMPFAKVKRVDKKGTCCVSDMQQLKQDNKFSCNITGGIRGTGRALSCWSTGQAIYPAPVA